MARSRRRPVQPGVEPTERPAPKPSKRERRPRVAPDLEFELGAHERAVVAASNLGVSYDRAASALNGRHMWLRLSRWTHLHGVETDDLCTQGDLWRVMPPGVIVSFLVQVARPHLARESFENDSWKLRRELQARGISCPGFTDDTDPRVGKAIRALATHLPIVDRRPTRPVMILNDTLRQIDDGISTHGRIGGVTGELPTAALRAFHRIAYWFGGRTTETISRMRWGYVDITDEDISILWPADVKRQAEPITLHQPRGLLCDPAEALQELRAALHGEGIDTGPDDAVFPWFHRGTVISNGVHGLINDPDRWPDTTDELSRQGLAELTVTHPYRNAWKAAAALVGFKPDALYRTGLHGPRRGGASDEAAQNKTPGEISARMRHGTYDTTRLYVDKTAITPDAVNSLIDLEATRETAADVDDLIGALHAFDEPGEGADDGRCVIVDDAGNRCEHESARYAADHGYVCDGHRARIDSGREITAPLAPPARQAPRPQLEPEPDDLGDDSWVCSAVDRDGLTCPRRLPVWSWAVNGEVRVLCEEHIERLRSGSVDWEEPLQVCAADCPANTNTHARLQTIEFDGEAVTLCHAHFRRWKTRHGTITKEKLMTRSQKNRTPEGQCCQAPWNGLVCGAQLPAARRLTLTDVPEGRLWLCGMHYARVLWARQRDREVAPDWGRPHRSTRSRKKAA